MKNEKIECGGVALAGRDKSEQFIPTIDEWWSLWTAWMDKIAASLWREGTKDECLEATKDAFLKVMGKHPTLKLEEELKPKVLGQWYKMLYHQARGILSNRHKHDDKSSFYSTSDEEEVGIFGENDFDLDAVGRSDLIKMIHSVIRNTCRAEGFTEKTIDGFFATKIGELSGKEVVATVKGIKNTNALYVRNKCVYDTLVKIAADKSSDLYGLWKETWGEGCSER